MSLPVSTAWKQAIQAQFRYPGYLRVELDVAPPGIADNTTVSSVTSCPWTKASDVIERQKMPDTPVLSLEHNRWCLDGAFIPVNDQNTSQNKLGWWSRNPIEDGVSTVFQFTFSQPYDLFGLYIRWDRQTSSWATDFTFVGYNTAGDVVATKHVTDAPAADGFYEISMSSVKVIKITFQGWSKPQWRARMEFVLFGKLVEFTNDRIQSADYTASVDLLSNSLPTMQCVLEATNYDQEFDPTLKTGAAAFLARQQQLKVRWGFETSYGIIEWLKEWPMYLSQWSIPADERVVKLTAISRLQFMTRKYIYGKYSRAPVTFKQLADTLMSNSSVIKEGASDKPWEFDAILSTLKTRAPLPIDTEKALLQLIANATGCCLDIDVTNGYIRIHKNSNDSGYIIDETQQLGDPSFKVAERLKSVKVGLHTFATKADADTVYSFDGDLQGTVTLQIEFDGGNIVENPTVTVKGATLKSSVFYARAGTLTVQAPAVSTEVSIEITGKVVEDSTTWIETYNDVDVVDGTEISIDNPMITEMSTLQAVADAAKAHYLQRTTTSIPYLGYPDIEVVDQVNVKSTYGNFTGQITKADLSFNGGFEGTLEVHNQ